MSTNYVNKVCQQIMRTNYVDHTRVNKSGEQIRVNHLKLQWNELIWKRQQLNKEPGNIVGRGSETRSLQNQESF